MISYIVILSAIVPMLLVLGILCGWRILRNRDRRRSPLTIKVLSSPGESLRRFIEKHDDRFHEYAAMATLIGPLVMVTWLAMRIDRSIDWSLLKFGPGDIALALITLLAIVVTAWRMIFHASKRRLYIQGLEAEQAVAQCLMPLMADGLAVFHDFPGDRFNIDHVVIGRGAVFAIETKSRKKPWQKGRESARVLYDGSKLHFPAHFESKPLDQAAVQAKWLQKFLGSGVGDPVRVVPVVALPGWFVENKVQRPEVLVSNCHNPAFMSSGSFGAEFDDAMRKRIAHVLIERYPSQAAP